MKKFLTTKLMDSFIDMLKSPGVLDNYQSYYSSIVNWVKFNQTHINEEVLKRRRLNILINLDPNIYIIDKPDISLSMEINRIKQIKPDTIDTLAMVIGDILWEMVTIKTGKDCPNCQYDELRFLLAQTTEQKLVLECESCGWCEYIDGQKWNEGFAKIIPASKKDLEKFRIKF